MAFPRKLQTAASGTPGLAPVGKIAADRLRTASRASAGQAAAAAPLAGGRTPSSPAFSKPAGTKTPSAGTLLLRLLASVHARARGVDAATALATELASGFACDRVSIATQCRQGMRLVAISHQSVDKERGSLLQLITAAMDEAAFQCATLRFPAEDAADRHILLAHAALSARLLNGCVLSVPMASERRVHGAMTFERPLTRPFSRQERQFFEHVASLVGPVLELKLARDEPWWRVVRSILRARLASLPLQGARARTALGAAALLLVALTSLPVPFRVSAPAHLEGHLQRALAAPADGFIKAAAARPGDEVAKGQLLAELDEEAFRLERDRRQSELVQLQSALGDALGKHDYAQIGVLSARVQEARANLDLASQQMQRTRLEAPFDGVVIKGDLTQSIGAPVRQGDTLFVLSPAQGHRVILDVDEKDIAEISVGQQGRLTLAAYPSTAIAFSVKRITPMAVAQDGRNYFEVEAAPSQAPERLRPGLQGVAKIDIERRALVWVLGHDLWHWLRLVLWQAFG